MKKAKKSAKKKAAPARAKSKPAHKKTIATKSVAKNKAPRRYFDEGMADRV
jgi:hypothetical protein